jgi:hypothetical protein
LAMYLPVAIGVYHDHIGGIVSSACGPGDDVVDMPPFFPAWLIP